MSRIGKKPISLPDKVKASVKDGKIVVTGPLGHLEFSVPSAFPVEATDKTVVIKRTSEENEAKALHGLYRSLVQNMVDGVSKGFTKILDIVGVGYKSEVKGKNLELNLGFSHPVSYPIPESIKVTVDKGVRITITGIDKRIVGEMAAQLRKIRPPEPYKGKGVRYADEIVKKKVGKAATAVGGK